MSWFFLGGGAEGVSMALLMSLFWLWCSKTLDNCMFGAETGLLFLTYDTSLKELFLDLSFFLVWLVDYGALKQNVSSTASSTSSVKSMILSKLLRWNDLITKLLGELVCLWTLLTCHGEGFLVNGLVVWLMWRLHWTIRTWFFFF